MVSSGSEKEQQLTKEMIELRRVIKKLLEDIEIKNVVDIGGGVEKTINQQYNERTEMSYYRDLLKTKNYKSIDIDPNADVSLDLNNVNKLPFKNKSVDLIIFSMIIEHLFDPRHICKEVARISRKYILLGTPNMMAWDSRLLFLLGKVNGMDMISDYTGHHHLWRQEMTQDIIKHYFRDFKIIKILNHGFWKGGNLLPFTIRFKLANFKPSLFSSHNYFLLKRRRI